MSRRNNRRNQNSDFILDIDYINQLINTENLFQGLIQEIYIQTFNDYYDELDNRIMNSVMEESLNEYKTCEKKPNIRINVESFSTTNEHKNELCTICTDNFELGDEITRLQCTHLYHTKCIAEWVMYKPECPCCKSHIQIKE